MSPPLQTKLSENLSLMEKHLEQKQQSIYKDKTIKASENLPTILILFI